MSPIEWCEQMIKEAQELGDYVAWENYQSMLQFWQKVLAR